MSSLQEIINLKRKEEHQPASRHVVESAFISANMLVAKVLRSILSWSIDPTGVSIPRLSNAC